MKVVKPYIYLLRDKSNIPALWEDLKSKDSDHIGGAPWKCRSGDVLIFKDADLDESHLIIKPEIEKPFQHVQESGVKIFSLEEQMIREAERISLIESKNQVLIFIYIFLILEC